MNIKRGSTRVLISRRRNMLSRNRDLDRSDPELTVHEGKLCKKKKKLINKLNHTKFNRLHTQEYRTATVAQQILYLRV